MREAKHVRRAAVRELALADGVVDLTRQFRLGQKFRCVLEAEVRKDVLAALGNFDVRCFRWEGELGLALSRLDVAQRFERPPTRPSSRVRAQKADLPTRGRWFEVYCHCALELRESFGRDEFRTMDVVNLTTVIHVDEMCYEPTVRRHGKRPCIRISLKSGRS